MAILKFFQRRLAFFIEVLVNGTFIVLFSLKQSKKLALLGHHDQFQQLLQFSGQCVPIVVLFSLLMAWPDSRGRIDKFLRQNIFSILVTVPLFLVWGDHEFTYGLAAVHLFSSFLNLAEAKGPQSSLVGTGGERWWTKILQGLSPTQLILLTFFGIIFAGSLLLFLPISSVTGESIPFVDALFMSTSATCVTGLATISVGNQLSLFGQLVLLALIQIGGLGIMTITSFSALFLGRSLDVRERVVMSDVLDSASFQDMLSAVRDIIKYTLVIEAWGCIVLTIAFLFEGFEFGPAFYNGLFHSISAFCNAGLSLFDTSLQSYSNRPFIHGTVAILITLGGLGFTVLKEVREKFFQPNFIQYLSLHTKVVLIVSAVLTFGGAIVIFFSEYLHALDGRSTLEQMQIALFQSVTTRTAGYDTIPMSTLQPHTLYFMTALMFIGASPGSTGGGIKTTTFAILVQSVRATLFSRERVEILDRTIPLTHIVKVTALTIISVIVALGAVFLVMWSESGYKHFDFLEIFFEVISAFGTVGLSMGITPHLTDLGKIIIAVVMYVGRVGPLTLVLGFGARERAAQFQYPEGRLMIG